jgi:hypothetical protein
MEKEIIKYGPWQGFILCGNCNSEIYYNDIYTICSYCGEQPEIRITDGKRLITNFYRSAKRKAYTYIPTIRERIFKFKRSEWHWERR